MVFLKLLLTNPQTPNIQIHDPITKEELEAIKQKQLAEGFNGE